MRVRINIDTNRGDFVVNMTEEEYDEVSFDNGRSDKSTDLSALISRAARAANAAYRAAK